MATVKVCDVCGKPADTTKHLVIGRETDGSGSRSDVYETFDLCWKHLALAACECYAIETQGQFPEVIFVDVIKAMQYQIKRAKT